jgi:acetyl esterase/lipase
MRTSCRFASYLVRHLICICLFATATHAQTLTVRDIMAEPSIAGMRADGEKLSPDGTKVVYVWNAEGKVPRDLYLVSTSGGEPVKILSPSDLPPPSRPPEKENKLDYGLVLRDDFAKARENQLGNFEWSPDSTKLVFSHGGDLYVLPIGAPVSVDAKNARWASLEAAIRDRLRLVRELVSAVEQAGIGNNEAVASIKKIHKDLDVSMQSAGAWDSQRGISLQIDRRLHSALDTLFASQQFRANERLVERQNELAGVANRIHVSRSDYEAVLGGNKYKRLTKTQAPETGARFLDNDRILFSQGGHLMIWDLKYTMITQVSRESNPQNFIGVFGAVPNKPGTLIAYVVSDSSKNKALVVPNYLDEFVAANPTRRGWTEQKVVVAPADGSRDTPFEIKLPKPEGVSNIRRMVWAADNSSLLVDRIDKDTKRRTLFYVYNVGSKSEKIIPIIEETDDKWQAALSNIFEPNPKDPSELFFGSEKDGFNHLYLAKLEAETRAVASVSSNSERVAEGPPGFTGKIDTKQLTKGDWQVEWAKWKDAERIVYTSTQKLAGRLESSSFGPAERQLYLINSDGFLNRMNNTSGMRTGFQISDPAEEPAVLFEGSKWNQPGELFVERISLKGAQEIRQLTQTTPERFRTIKWTQPKLAEIPSRDNKKIPAKIYLPAGFNAKTKSKYPMVVFVHGAGYLQNVINGWNNYYREFMFNDLLAKKGYVVLDIDYRGSAGYGRDWRTDVYDFLGGKDYDDHIDSIDYMVANYNVNPAKVGAYGGSYGGFMAGMLVMRAPDKIAAAAALRPVFDWKNYYATNPGYTAQRLGFPDKNPEAYKRSSPITYADKLERPLLILHGMSDDNVHVQDSIQLMEKLIRLGKTKYFEAMLYPSENHGFARPESWTDEYERILAFFEKHLK